MITVRRVLRFVGLVMLLVGIASVVLLVVPGPTEVARWIGGCRDDYGPVQECDAVDAIGFLLSGTGTLIVVGAVLLLALRPDGSKPATLNLRWLGRLLRLGR